MGIKHLFAYSLIIIGVALFSIVVLFYFNGQIFNAGFLLLLALSAAITSLCGGLLLKGLSR